MKQIRIKNFGPISDAVINIKAFTVFGGANNTGKSFASRLIYSIIKSLQNDLYSQRVNRLIGYLQHPSFIWEIEEFASRRKKKNKKAIQTLNSISTLASRLTVELEELDSKDLNSTAIKKLVSETIDGIDSKRHELTVEQPNLALAEIVEQLDSYLEYLRYVNDLINLPNVQDNFIHYQLKENIERELVGNFQIPSISTLFGHAESTPSVQFTEGNTKIEFALTRELREPKGLQIKIRALNSIREYPSCLFLESPVYWKLERLFVRPYRTLRFEYQERTFARRAIPGVPDYVTSMRTGLSKEYTGEVAFPGILNWIQSVLDGRIVVSPNGQLRFSDGKGYYPLQTTATGITNIGMIGLLIERKLINEQTVLFIDEPECNLHTAWQVIMAELLMKLSRAGVQVVIATHSAEILKYVVNYSKSDPDFAKDIAVNRFPDCNDEDQDLFLQLRKILGDLTKPYSNLYWDDT